MGPIELVAYFGGVSATARALGVKPPSVSEWLSRGVVPKGRQYQVEVLTGGALRAGLSQHAEPPPETQQAHDRAA